MTPRYIAVYGTLRPGNGNARLWEGRATAHWDGEAVVHGYALVTNGAFPYATPAVMSQSVVALIEPHEGEYDDVLADMDYLEGVPSHYDRIEVAVLTPAGPVIAWMYVPARIDSYLANLPDVETDDLGRHDWSERTPRRFTHR